MRPTACGCRGRTRSRTDTTPWSGPRKLEGCNGRVGMFGASYTGNTQLKAAIAGPPSLRAIAPMQTWADPADGLMFRGGAMELGINKIWTLGQAVGGLMKTLDGEELGHALVATVHDIDNLHQDGYWHLPSASPAGSALAGQPDIGVARALEDPSTLDESRVAGHYDDVTVPSLNIAGWYDIFQQGTLDNYVEMRSRGRVTQLVVGPWDHMSVYGMTLGQTGDVHFGIASIPPGPDSADLSDGLLTWFDPWLKDTEPEAEPASGVRIFVMGANEWRDEPDWPLERAVDTPLYLASGGALSFEPPTQDGAASSFTYDPMDPVPTTGGAHFTDPHFPRGPVDQREVEQRSDVLVYTTAPLEQDLEVTGRIRATLFAVTDAPTTDWVARLCVVDRHGVSRNLVDGIVRVKVTPGEIAEHEIDLWSTSVVVAAGERLRVHVTSSNFPRWDRNLNTDVPNANATRHQVASQSVWHDVTRPSRLILPVVRP